MKREGLISQTSHKRGIDHALILNDSNIGDLSLDCMIENAKSVITEFVMEKFAVENDMVVQKVDDIYLRVQLMSFLALMDNAPYIHISSTLDRAFASKKRCMDYEQKTVTVKYTVELVFSSMGGVVEAPRIEVTAVCVDGDGNELKDTTATFVYPEIACAMFMYSSANMLTEKYNTRSLVLTDESYDVLWKLFGMQIRDQMVKNNFWKRDIGMHMLPVLAVNNAMNVYRTYHTYLYYALSDYMGDKHAPEVIVMDSTMLMSMYTAVIQSKDERKIDGMYNDIATMSAAAAGVKLYDNAALAEAAQEISYSKVVDKFNAIVRLVLGETDEDGFSTPQAASDVQVQHMVVAHLHINNTEDILSEISELISDLIKAVSEMEDSTYITFNSLIKAIRCNCSNTDFLQPDQVELLDSVCTSEEGNRLMGVSMGGCLPHEGLYNETHKTFQHRVPFIYNFRNRVGNGEVTYDDLQDIRFNDSLELKTGKHGCYRRSPANDSLRVLVARTDYQQDYVDKRRDLDMRVRNKCHANELPVILLTTLYSVLRELESNNDSFAEAYGDPDTYLQLLNKILTSDDEYVSQYPGVEFVCGQLWYTRCSLNDTWWRYYHKTLD